jgi:hypothetical protein
MPIPSTKVACFDVAGDRVIAYTCHNASHRIDYYYYRLQDMLVR